MTKQVKAPNSRRNLDIAIDRLCARTDDNPNRIKRLIASVIVGQMLPDGAAKGSNALKIRFGKDVTRFSRALDTARASFLEDYIGRLESSLAAGWARLTGVVVHKKPHAPKNVPRTYIMHPFELKLSYNGKSWMTLPLEVGHNEIGDADDPDMVESAEAAQVLAELGFPKPGPVPCMKLEHQIAQKLHAVSSAGSERAHDLVDLQIVVNNGNVDYRAACKTCERLFAYRKEQAWPPIITKGEGWDALYAAQAEGLDVPGTVDEAVAWANALVAKIATSTQDNTMTD